MTNDETDPCPCGGGPYVSCCGRYHAGREQAPTAEALMRSRYSAFARGLADYVFRTWHPRTRPADVRTDGVTFTGLDVVDVVGGLPGDETGVVEFVAHYRDGDHSGALRERSRFARRAGRWMYLDTDAAAAVSVNGRPA